VRADRRAGIALIAEVAKAHPGVFIIDSVSSLCAGSVCKTSRNQPVPLSDGNHLSVEGARLLGPAFRAVLGAKGANG
jgi:hypothetical protein